MDTCSESRKYQEGFGGSSEKPGKQGMVRVLQKQIYRLQFWSGHPGRLPDGCPGGGHSLAEKVSLWLFRTTAVTEGTQVLGGSSSTW